MIVDCHTQLWSQRPKFDIAGAGTLDPGSGGEAKHLQAIDTVDRAIVLGFKSIYLQAELSNGFVAEYVRRHAPKLIGFAGIDPTDDRCIDELRAAREDLRLEGATVSPALQNYHPSDTRAMRFYEECARLGMPVLFELDLHSAAAKLEYSRPVLLDEIAREFPALRMIVAQMGFPWVDETIVLLGKHRNVYADVSSLLARPWQCYTALLAAFECGVMDKLLFGSGFPYLSPAEGIEALYSVNQLSVGSNLVAIPRERLRGIVERDALKLLGIGQATPSRPRPEPVMSTFDHDD